MKIAVAHIEGPRGFKGEVKAVLYRHDSQSLKPGLEITISRDEKTMETTVDYIKPLRKRLAVKFEGIDDEQTAESWRGGEILMEIDQLDPLPELEFYHFQIEGAEVFELDGTSLGTVERVEGVGANDILVVRTADGEILIPFVRAIVKSVDIEGKKIVIEKIEGLY